MNTTTPARHEFEAALSAYDDKLTLTNTLSKEAQARFDEAANAEFVSRFGKRKQFSRSKANVLMGDWCRETFSHMTIELADLRAEKGCCAAALKSALSAADVLAQSAEIVAGAEFRRWVTVSEQDYHTQGYCARKYAESSAQMRWLDAEVSGVEAVVESELVTFAKSSVVRESFSVMYFHVNVKVSSDTDIAILNRRPGAALKDAVKMFLRRGANPRVFFPFLEHGYEMSHRIDAFGEEIAP